MSIAESEERETGRTVQAMRKRNGRCRKARAVPKASTRLGMAGLKAPQGLWTTATCHLASGRSRPWRTNRCVVRARLIVTAIFEVEALPKPYYAIPGLSHDIPWLILRSSQ